MAPADAGGAYPRHNWLPAVLPADARRFRIADPKLASTMRAAGAELVDSAPDVEIARAEHLRGDAETAIVLLDVVLPEGGSRPVRAARRLLGFARVRLETVAARREVKRRGYETTRIVPWEWEQAARLPGGHAHVQSPSLPERMPLGALVVGTHRPPGPTLLDEALAAASRTQGTALGNAWPLVRQGGLVAIGHDSVVRVALGPARHELELLRTGLEALEAYSPPPIVAERIPWLRGVGTAGLAEWSLEKRLPGSAPPLALPEPLLAECVEFLVELHLTSRSLQQDAHLADSAEVIAAACQPQVAEAIRRLGSQLDEELADIPRGFGHGDFWTRNLLTERGRLTGVVDWHGASSDRLPVVDLLHLRLSSIFQRKRQYLGEALIEHLLPWAQARGDRLVDSYCQRIDLTLDSARLESLVKAYWLTRTARELELYADRVERPVWMHRNVEVVIPALVARA